MSISSTAIVQSIHANEGRTWAIYIIHTVLTWAMSMPGSFPRCVADSTRKSVSMDNSRVSKKSCMHMPCRHVGLV